MTILDFLQVLVSVPTRVSTPPKTLKISKHVGALNRGNTVCTDGFTYFV